MFSGMITVEGFLFYGIQGNAGSLAVYKAVEDAIDILPDAAGTLAAGRDLAFIGAKMAVNAFTMDLFVIQGFFHFISGKF